MLLQRGLGLRGRRAQPPKHFWGIVNRNNAFVDKDFGLLSSAKEVKISNVEARLADQCGNSTTAHKCMTFKAASVRA